MSDKPLVDDLADVLSRMVVGWKPWLGRMLSDHPDVQRVMARYRASKIPCEAHVWHGPGHQSKTMCEVREEHTYHFARLAYGEVEWDGFMVGSVDDNGTVHERVYCDQDGCHVLREPGDIRLCRGFMHPRNRS